jgi:predicted methyltransferase
MHKSPLSRTFAGLSLLAGITVLFPGQAVAADPAPAAGKPATIAAQAAANATESDSGASASTAHEPAAKDTATGAKASSASAVPTPQDSVEIPPATAAAVAATDRSEADRALDAGRKPAETLAFFGIEPGMRVAEIAAAGGYTTELLARVVGEDGAVLGVNSPFVLNRFAEKPWTERLAKPVMAKVTRLDRAFDDPFPADLRGLDAVVNVLFYHDTYWQGVDRMRMNRAIYKALKPGGIYGIVDHGASVGRGSQDVQTLHRVEKRLVVGELEAAGFELVDEADFLTNPDDARDWNAAPNAAGERRGTSDRFVLKFRRP